MKDLNKGQNKNSQNTSWGKVADWYDDLLTGDKAGSTYQSTLILPNLKRLVEPRPGIVALDLACGQGMFARAWAASGAKVMASDISPELINIAKNSETSNEAKIEYFVSPSSNISFAKDDSVNIITCVLALQNIEDLAATFKECARVLKSVGTKDSGKMFVVLNHPAFRIPKASSWGFDQTLGVQYRRIDSYMTDSKVNIDMSPGKSQKDGGVSKNFTVSFHRPLQVYFKALNKAGLAVTRLEEWVSNKESQPGARSEAENISRKEIPLFLCLEIVKLPANI